MKALIIILILAIIGYAIWKFIEAKRIKDAKKPSIHKVSVKPAPSRKPTKKRKPNGDAELMDYNDEPKLKN